MALFEANGFPQKGKWTGKTQGMFRNYFLFDHQENMDSLLKELEYAIVGWSRHIRAQVPTFFPAYQNRKLGVLPTFEEIYKYRKEIAGLVHQNKGKLPFTAYPQEQRDRLEKQAELARAAKVVIQPPVEPSIPLEEETLIDRMRRLRKEDPRLADPNFDSWEEPLVKFDRIPVPTEEGPEDLEGGNDEWTLIKKSVDK
jgi:hypothetical protein